jgi:thiol-disulfide isomerase/thioredoxin
MIKFLSFILLFSFLSAPIIAQNQKSIIRFLIKSEKQSLKKHTYSYSAKLSIKEPLQVDTFKSKGQVMFSQNRSDIFFGYDLFVQTDVINSYYTFGKYYRIDNYNQKIYPGRFLDPKKITKNKGPFFQSQSDHLLSPFLRSDSMYWNLIHNPKYVLSRGRTSFCSDTILIVAKELTGHATVNNDTLMSYTIEYKFDRKTKLPIQITKKGVGKWSDYYWNLEMTPNDISEDSVVRFFYSYKFPNNFEMVENEVVTIKSKPQKFRPLPVPNFILNDFKGNVIKIEDLKGKVVLLDFWYSTCPPCLKASQFIEEFQTKYADSNFVVLGMNPVDNSAKISKHYQRWQLNYNSLICTVDLKNILDVNTYPTFILIDSNGMIVYKNSGFSHGLMHEIESEIQNAIRKN